MEWYRSSRATKSEKKARRRETEQTQLDWHRSRAEARQLASMLRAKLPRELRDAVYAYACVEDYTIMDHEAPKLRHYLHGDGKGVSEHDSEKSVCSIDPDRLTEEALRNGDQGSVLEDDNTGWMFNIDTDCLAGEALSDEMPRNCILDPDFVGKDVALEAAEVYYSQNMFDVNHHRHLSAFLTHDPFDAGFAPYEHICKLTVIVNLQTPYLVGYTMHDIKGEMETLEEVYTTLERGFALFSSKRQREIHVRIETELISLGEDADHDHERRLHNILEAVRKPVYDLMHCYGCKVSVFHDDRSFVLADITHYFRLTSEEWQEEKDGMQRSSNGWNHAAHCLSPWACDEELLSCITLHRWGVSCVLDVEARERPEDEFGDSDYFPGGYYLDDNESMVYGYDSGDDYESDYEYESDYMDQWHASLRAAIGREHVKKANREKRGTGSDEEDEWVTESEDEDE